MAIVEYIWIDGVKPTAKLRAKTKILPKGNTWCISGGTNFKLVIEGPAPMGLTFNLPIWNFDGSSTEQADGDNSDCMLVPIRMVNNPLKKVDGHKCLLVLCEVLDSNNQHHVSNTRCATALLQEKYSNKHCMFGIEQEYTFYHGSRHAGDVGIPFGWPVRGPANPQGKYYCGVGADEVFGREIVDEHETACLEAEIPISGVNAEVMPGQWEFQVGPCDALAVSDYLWLARYLLYRVAEKYKVTVKLDPKPLAGDWNGAGAHTNVSTVAMRSTGGKEVILEACEKLKNRFNVEGFPSVYGDGYENRLTGVHETCSYKEFRYSVKDRTASIRIPIQVDIDGKGYFEDRRPCANIDPYQVTSYIMETICGPSF